MRNTAGGLVQKHALGRQTNVATEEQPSKRWQSQKDKRMTRQEEIALGVSLYSACLMLEAGRTDEVRLLLLQTADKITEDYDKYEREEAFITSIKDYKSERRAIR